MLLCLLLLSNRMAGEQQPHVIDICRRAMELRPGDAHHPEYIVGAAGGEFGFYLFSVRLTVRSGVEPRDENRLVFLRANCLRRRKIANKKWDNPVRAMTKPKPASQIIPGHQPKRSFGNS